MKADSTKEPVFCSCGEEALFSHHTPFGYDVPLCIGCMRELLTLQELRITCTEREVKLALEQIASITIDGRKMKHWRAR